MDSDHFEFILNSQQVDACMEPSIKQTFTTQSRRGHVGQVRVFEKYLRNDIECRLSVQMDHYLLWDLETIGIAFLLRQNEQFQSEIKKANYKIGKIYLQTAVEYLDRFLSLREMQDLEKYLKQNTEDCVYFPNEHVMDTLVSPTYVYNYEESYVHKEDEVILAHKSIESALNWFQAHAGTLGVPIIFITTHEKIYDQNPMRMTYQQYIEKYHANNPILQACLEESQDVNQQKLQTSSSNVLGNEEDQMQEHYPAHEIEKGLKAQILFKGQFQVNPYHPQEAFLKLQTSISNDNAEDKILMIGSLAQNRALHGDQVVVKLLPRDQWTSSISGEKTLMHNVDNDELLEQEPGSGPRAAAKDRPDRVLFPNGIVVGILHRASRSIIATVLPDLDQNVNNTSDYLLAVPMDFRYPKIRIRSRTRDAITGVRLVVVIDHWQVHSRYPHGHYTRLLGPANDFEVEIRSLMIQHDILDEPYSDAAVACLPLHLLPRGFDLHRPMECCTFERKALNQEITHLSSIWDVHQEGGPFSFSLDTNTATTLGRVDCRDCRVFSIDPEGCRDIDDAMSISGPNANGLYELGIHIADVTTYVIENSPLDEDAKRRATSVYLIDRRYDMLPPLLSTDVASLHANVDRLALSVFYDVEFVPQPLGQAKVNFVNAPRFAQTIIHSRAALTYEQATAIVLTGQAPAFPATEEIQEEPLVFRCLGAGSTSLHSSTLVSELQQDIEKLTLISQSLYERRVAQGALDLSSQVELMIEAKATDVHVDVHAKCDMHDTVAELMILANTSVASQILQHFPSTALIRNHAAPSTSRLEQVAEIAAQKQIEFDGSTNVALQQSMTRMEQSQDISSDVLTLIKSVVTRAMSEAQYMISSGSGPGTSNVGHYGLGVDEYTHFTSPIRRYADVIVHRQLKQSMMMMMKHAKHLIPTTCTVSPSPMKIISLPASITPSVLKPTQSHPRNPPSASKNALTGQTQDLEDDRQTQVCDHLNLTNRHAKTIARACQMLYLVEYFKHHTVVTTGIIAKLFRNGFVVYLPTFDIKGPVYFYSSTSDGVVQGNPEELDIPLSDTEPAAEPFAQVSPNFRSLVTASLSLEKDERLVLSTTSSAKVLTFERMDQIQVRVSASLSSSSSSTLSTARPAQVRMYFLTSTGRGAPVEEALFDLKKLSSGVQSSSTCSSPTQSYAKMKNMSSSILYDSIESWKEKQPYACTSLVHASLKSISMVSRSKSKHPHVSKASKIMDHRKAKQKKTRLNRGRCFYGNYCPLQTSRSSRPYHHDLDEWADEETNWTTTKPLISSSISSCPDQVKEYTQEAQRRQVKLAAQKRHDRVARRHKK